MSDHCCNHAGLFVVLFPNESLHGFLTTSPEEIEQAPSCRELSISPHTHIHHLRPLLPKRVVHKLYRHEALLDEPFAGHLWTGTYGTYPCKGLRPKKHRLNSGAMDTLYKSFLQRYAPRLALVVRQRGSIYCLYMSIARSERREDFSDLPLFGASAKVLLGVHGFSAGSENSVKTVDLRRPSLLSFQMYFGNWHFLLQHRQLWSHLQSQHPECHYDCRWISWGSTRCPPCTRGGKTRRSEKLNTTIF